MSDDLIIRNVQPTSLQFHAANDWFVKIHSDGRVEINEDFTMDEAAMEFWRCVIKMAPEFFGQEQSSTFERCMRK